jgi:hypothetical protein
VGDGVESDAVRNLCLTTAIEELAKAGIRDPVIAHGAKHPQIRWTTPRGESRVFAVPGTPSDWRSAENVRRDLRKILRADGLLLGLPEPRSPAPLRQPSRIELLERRLAEIERRLGIRGDWQCNVDSEHRRP